MADITMCRPAECPRKEMCYRFTATPNNLYQSYFVDPVDACLSKDFACYWEVQQNKETKHKPTKRRG
jgi:hypothetical protein